MSGFVKTSNEREIEILKHRLDKIEKRLDNQLWRSEPDSLGSSVPPGSDSTLRGNGPRERWNMLGELARVKGELDAAHQHVKILETSQREAIAACLRSCAHTITESRMDGPNSAGYIVKYADAVQSNYEIPTPAGGHPASDPAAQPDSNTPGSDSALRKRADHIAVILDRYFKGEPFDMVAARRIIEVELSRMFGVA